MKTEVGVWQNYDGVTGLKAGPYERNNGEIVQLQQDEKSRFFYIDKDNEPVYLVWG